MTIDRLLVVLGSSGGILTLIGILIGALADRRVKARNAELIRAQAQAAEAQARQIDDAAFLAARKAVDDEGVRIRQELRQQIDDLLKRVERAEARAERAEQVRDEALSEIADLRKENAELKRCVAENDDMKNEIERLKQRDKELENGTKYEGTA